MIGLRVWGYVFVVSFCCFRLLAVAEITDRSEVSALIAINKMLIDPMKHLKNWNKGDPCTSNWAGVICFDAVGSDGYLHVQVLQMLNMNLSGSLAPEIGLLSQLQILDFMWNDLSGSIPKEIGNITSLKLLLLNGNNLSGPLPKELGYLSNLNRFQIDQNRISGKIPESFSNLNSVEHIHFNNNSISGQIPPQLSNLSSLLHLLVDNNNLTGYLPSVFSNFPKLRILSSYGSSLSVPSGLFNSLGSCYWLRNILDQLDNNNFSKAEIPASYGNLSTLLKLSLRNCHLQGPVPDLSGIPKLHYLDLSQNLLTGPIPSNQLSRNVTTIDLSNNQINGTIPESFSDLPSLQKLLLGNNNLTGSVPANIWQNKSFGAKARLEIDLRNNSLSIISKDPYIPSNVTLRLQGNPICSNADILNIDQFCGSVEGGDDNPGNSTNSNLGCPIQSCPINNNYEYVPESPERCFCASPLRIEYRLKSPSFSYFRPYTHLFEMYLTSSLHLEIYQLFIESFVWEKGPRLRMNLKLFPMVSKDRSDTFNKSEIRRIRDIFTSWDFHGDDLLGPYELLDFTLLGPYSNMNFDTHGKSVSKGVLVAIILAAVAFAITISAAVTFLVARRRARHQHTLSRKRLSSKLSIKIEGAQSFTFKEMAMATDDFNISTQVGQGGYGEVYRGILSDNTIVAIKRAKTGSLQGKKEFLTEIEMLSRLHHRNLVSLVGYCDEEGEQMLVYEFMPNGTLQDWLSAKFKDTLHFGMRLRIALGSAKGILYLHTEADPPIFHRDIKASNILLDSNLIAKVADFGLSRLAPVMDDEGMLANHVSTIVKGTPGYVDPEYFLTRNLTDKSDVYSLGVVFMEILTGRKPISHGKNIVREVNLARQSGKMSSVIDSRMGSYPTECMERFADLAVRCCQDKPEERPSMLDVVRELENILKIMPAETGLDWSSSSSSLPKSKYFGESSSTSSLAFAGRDPCVSSADESGSGLVSGAFPTIRPR